MQPPLQPGINTIATEQPETPETKIPVEGDETGGSGLSGEVGAEKFAPKTGTTSPKKKDDKDDDKKKTTPASTKSPKVIDKSEGVTKVHPVAPDADTLTTLADDDEKEFIEGVEAAHHGH